jgi:hypothetical protein
MTRIGAYIFTFGIAACSTAALAQELPVGTPNGLPAPAPVAVKSH